MPETEDPTIEIARRSDMPGRLVSRYRLIEKVGAGGTAAVYRACDDTTGRTLAFKQLLGAARSPHRAWLEAMFQREYHTLIRLKHPRVIEVYDYGVGEAGPFYTMELLEGQDIQQLAPLPYREVCAHVRDLASVLALLQAHRLVHRDVSPRNVRVTHKGARLIDFGTLHGFGVSAELVGTAPFVAPESYWGMPLDQRTDLFSLGAFAYFALTGRYAFHALQFDELPQVWQTSPTPPSEFAPDVPPELDALVLGLLELDPMLRPSSPAAVIDRLNAIAGLEPEAQRIGAENYLRSAPMVGRELEQKWMSARLPEALEGRGCVAVLEGPRGIGKTRLLHELALQAQLAGVVVLKADGEASGVAFGVATALALDLLARCPVVAREQARPHAALLAHLSPRLREQLGVVTPSQAAVAPSEQQSRLRNALAQWFAQVARSQPLGLAVDNIQAVDEASAAVLATLGFGAGASKLLLLLTHRPGDVPVAPAAVRALRKQATQISLGALTPQACQQWVDAVFGEAANTARAAWLLHQNSAGNPQHCAELVRMLVRSQTATYRDGMWVLPLHLADDTLPSRVEHIVEAKLDALASDARRMAEVLSIHDNPVPLELCLAFSEAGPEQAHWALQELVSADILVSDRSNYRFAHDPVREFVVASMDEGTRRAHHLRAAEVLLEHAGDDPLAQVQAGWHLVRGGDETHGADQLARAGRRLLGGELGLGNPDQIAPLLRVALEVYEREQRSELEIASVLFPLVSLAFLSSDWRLILEHAERVMELGLRVTGLGLAQSLRGRVGRRVALSMGLLRAATELKVRRRSEADLGLRELLVLFCTAAQVVLSTLMICNDEPAVERIRRKLSAFNLFGADHLVSLVHEIGACQALVAQGCFGDSLQDFERLQARTSAPRIKLALGEARWSYIHGGMLMIAAEMAAFGFGDCVFLISVMG